MIRLISQFLQQWKLCSPLNGIINSKLCPVKKAIEAILGAFRLVWPHAAQYCHVMDSLFEWSSCFFWSRDSFIRYVLLILPNAMDFECLSGHTPQFFTFWIVVVNPISISIGNTVQKSLLCRWSSNSNLSLSLSVSVHTIIIFIAHKPVFTCCIR